MNIFNDVEELQNVDPALQVPIFIIAIAIVILGVVSGIVSIILAIKYYRFNRKQNSRFLTGEQAARRILDSHNCQDIRVSCVGSILFGNSYSHWFKKVRLRRLTYRKTSITSLAMAAQKSSLAILDREGDKQMRTRVYLNPIIIFGPIAFIPLIVIGVLLDYLLFNSTGKITIVFAVIAIAFYVLSFILSLLVLKTEMNAQKRAMQILRENDMANEEEIDDMKTLFKLYNIEYVNNMIIAFLELLYKVLIIVSKFTNRGSSSSSNN